MQTIAFNNMNVEPEFKPNYKHELKPNTATLENARQWIGRQLILERPLLTFEPGTLCMVMCIVDFGDGPLLWIVTDDQKTNEVDQIQLSDVSHYFRDPQAEKLIQAN